ncbi:MAG: cytochrome c oxidase subunit II [Ferruginibacter sp.]
MTQILVIAIVIMIFIVIFQISKASEYVSVLKGEEKARKQNNKINAFLLVAFLVLGIIGCWYCNDLYYSKTLFPQGAASEMGEKIDLMLYITIGVTGVVFFITQILLFWFSFKYQEKDDRKAYYFPHNTKLELLWTTVPAIFLTVLVVFGLKYWFKMTGEAPKNSVIVEVTGHQFGWEFRYPGPDKMLGKKNYKLTKGNNGLGVDFSDPASQDDMHVAGTVHIPVGKPVKFVINAQDVIHDVGLSHFRLKMDAVPGIPTTLWFTPLYTTEQMKIRSGNPNFVYEISCDQMCGRGHFSMRGVIIVETEEEYRKYLAGLDPEYWTVFPDKKPKSASPSAPAGTDTTKSKTPLAAIMPASH